MKYAVSLAVMLLILCGISYAEDPANYDWADTVDIDISTQGQHSGVLDMPTPAPTRTNVYGWLWGDYDQPYEAPDADNEKITGTVVGIDASHYLELWENGIRGGGDAALDKTWRNVNLNVMHPTIHVSHGAYIGNDNFFFNKAHFYAHAWSGDVTPSGPQGQ